MPSRQRPISICGILLYRRLRLLLVSLPIFHAQGLLYHILTSLLSCIIFCRLPSLLLRLALGSSYALLRSALLTR